MKQKTIQYSQILLGIIFTSFGLKAFLIPNGFLDGGVTGIALLVNSLTGIKTSIFLVIVTIPFLVMAYFYLSKKIALISSISISILACFLYFETFPILTEDKLLISIFGGLFVGLGIGLTIKNGAVLDGSEILGVILNERFGLSIGTIILLFNTVLFLISAWLISVETAMYSILTFIVSAKVLDYVIKGFEDFIGVMVISDKHEVIIDHIKHNLGAGITCYKSYDSYGKSGIKKDKIVIHTIVNRIDLNKVHKLVNDIDRDSFVVEYDVNKVSGGILRRYLNKTLG